MRVFGKRGWRRWAVGAVSIGTLCGALLLGGCGVTPPGSSNTDRVAQALAEFDKRPLLTYDAAQYPVTIQEVNSENAPQTFTYTKPPERIVAVWQNSIETLIALGVGDRIMAGMGVPDAKYLLPAHREAYERIPIKSLQELSVESVLSMRPDFILAWYSTFQDKVLRGSNFWLERKVNTYIAPSSTPSRNGQSVHTLDNEYRYIEDLGKIFNRQDKAQSIVGEMRREVEAVEQYTATAQTKPRALVIEFEGRGDIRVYGARTLAGDMVRTLHGDLLAPDLDKIAMEQILALNPEALFIVVTEDDYADPEKYLKKVFATEILQEVTAVKEKRVFILPLYTVYCSGIRTLDGLRILERGLYPNMPLREDSAFPADAAVSRHFNPNL